MAEEFIKTTIQTFKVVIFSKSYCPFCRKVKILFDQLSVPYHAVELDQRADGATIQGALGQMTGAHTVPRVFIGGDFIGGSDDTHRLFNEGELQRRLIQVGIHPSSKQEL